MKLGIYANNVGAPGTVIRWTGTSAGSAVLDESGSVCADDAIQVGGTYSFTVDAEKPLPRTTLAPAVDAATFHGALRDACKHKGSPLTREEVRKIHASFTS
jgi:hypothetical protein